MRQRPSSSTCFAYFPLLSPTATGRSGHGSLLAGVPGARTFISRTLRDPGDLDRRVVLAVAPVLALVRLVLVREALDLGALGRTNDARADCRRAQLGRGGEHGVAVDQHDGPKIDLVTLEQFDVEPVAFGNLVLLAAGFDHCVHDFRPLRLNPEIVADTLPLQSRVTSMSLRVVVAEDNLLVREGVVTLLEHQDGIEVCGAVGSYDDLMDAVEREKPDVVLTDIRMPPTGTDEGIRAALTLRDSHPETAVVVLSQYADPAYALALLERGSEGRAYLLKERVSEPEQLTHAIEEVARGGSVIDPIVVEALVAQRTSRKESALTRLTPRER